MLAENGPYAAAIVVVEILLYQQVENNYLSPRISAKTIELNASVALRRDGPETPQARVALPLEGRGAHRGEPRTMIPPRGVRAASLVGAGGCEPTLVPADRDTLNVRR